MVKYKRNNDKITELSSSAFTKDIGYVDEPTAAPIAFTNKKTTELLNELDAETVKTKADYNEQLLDNKIDKTDVATSDDVYSLYKKYDDLYYAYKDATIEIPTGKQGAIAFGNYGVTTFDGTTLSAPSKLSYVDTVYDSNTDGMRPLSLRACFGAKAQGVVTSYNNKVLYLNVPNFGNSGFTEGTFINVFCPILVADSTVGNIMVNINGVNRGAIQYTGNWSTSVQSIGNTDYGSIQFNNYTFTNVTTAGGTVYSSSTAKVTTVDGTVIYNRGTNAGNTPSATINYSRVYFTPYTNFKMRYNGTFWEVLRGDIAAQLFVTGYVNGSITLYTGGFRKYLLTYEASTGNTSWTNGFYYLPKLVRPQGSIVECSYKSYVGVGTANGQSALLPYYRNVTEPYTAYSNNAVGIQDDNFYIYKLMSRIDVAEYKTICVEGY